jgi:hypothetical protein
LWKGANRTIGAAHDEASAAKELEAHVIAGLRKLALVANDLPGRQQQMLALELMELLAVIGPGGERPLQRGIHRRRRLRQLHARRRGRLDTRREPGEDAAEIGAALAARRLAIESVALEKNSLPLLVDEAHEALGDRVGIRPRAVAAGGDEPLAEVYDHPAPG